MKCILDPEVSEVLHWVYFLMIYLLYGEQVRLMALVLLYAFGWGMVFCWKQTLDATFLNQVQKMYVAPHRNPDLSDV